MKHIAAIHPVAILVLALFAAACNQPAETVQTDAAAQEAVGQKSETGTEATGDLAFLKDLDGKYPRDAALFDNSAFTRRLEKLTGSRYPFIKGKWNVETPMEVASGVFVASACERHNCDATNFIVVYDFAGDTLSAGVREEGQVQTFAETGKPAARVTDWAEQN
jgi:hypothetical protein